MTATSSGPARDGRSARWEGHRLRRRRELVESAIRTIRARGASVGMDDIAAAAGTSKTVFYRHFTDRQGLYRAVAERVDELIMRDVSQVLGRAVEDVTAGEPAEPRDLVAAAIDSYLRLVERDPEIYRFIVAAPAPAGRAEEAARAAHEASEATGRMARQMGALIAEALVAQGQDPAPARVWGHALVGMVQAAADAWIAGLLGDLGRAVLVEQLTRLAWDGVQVAWAPPA